MEGFVGSSFNNVTAVTKKPRSTASRRPRPDSQFVLDCRDVSPLSSSSPDKSAICDTSLQKKELSLNSSVPQVSSYNKTEILVTSRKNRKDDKKYGNLDDLYGNDSSKGGQAGSDSRRYSEGVLTPANWKSISKSKFVSERQSRSPDGYVARSEGYNQSQSVEAPTSATENKLRKVKLKVGGVTRTIHAKSENDKGSGSSAKPSSSPDAPPRRPKLMLQENSDDDHTPAEKESGLQGGLQKDLNSRRFTHGASEPSRGKVPAESLPSSEAVRKSKRLSKRRALDGAFDDVDGDEETPYLERLKNQKREVDNSFEHEDHDEDSSKRRKISKFSKTKKIGYELDGGYGLLLSLKDSKKKHAPERESYDTDYVEDEEPGSDDDTANKLDQEIVEALPEARPEPLTTRQRALQSGKAAGVGGSMIEFPDGLPPQPPRRQKGKLSEVEQQAKRAEAAQRRKLLVQKQNEELEAEAIKKILGQDSNRKKKEEKERKERDEKAQRRAAESLVLASSTIRWVIGPAGTVVTFADDVGLPSILCSKPCSYPPPREKCAGPSCTNAYKYRDSKLNLPLCSLRCYKAIQGNSQSVSTF